MISKEDYKSTYNDIHVSAELLEKLEDMARQKKTGKRLWRLAIAAAAAICIICGAVNYEKVLTFARAFWGTVVISGTHAQMRFGDIQIIPIDIEKFITDKGTQKERKDLETYSHDFSSYEEMNQFTGLVLPAADTVTYKDLSVSLSLDEDLRHGFISTKVIYNDIQFDMDGMFALKGYQWDAFGITTSRNVVETIAYGDGKKAYYLKKDETDEGEVDGVINFEENGILLDLRFDYAGDEKTQERQAKELLKVFGE